MSGLSAFLKQNKKYEDKKEYFAASESFVDEKGNPVLWEIRAISSREAEAIRSECNQVVGKKIITDNAKFNRKLAAACTVFPNLLNAELQDSYGVCEPEELIMEMLDNDYEYQQYVRKVMEICGYTKQDQELKDEAKN